MNYDLRKLEQVPRNEEKYQKSKELAKKYDSMKMFELDMLYNSGKIYKLPFIPYAGDLANNAYVKFNTNGIQVYTINGYLQPVFSLRENGKIDDIQMDSMPFAYYRPIMEFINQNVII